MAQKRMFSLKVIDTDNFLDMPGSARLLYYDFGMRADDDGFVSNPKKIINMTKASDDDYKILIAKQYIIPFQSGICVIKHWHIHNLIRSDRYSASEYEEEKKSLMVINGKYDLIHGIPNVIPCDIPTVRIGKVSIDKVSIDKVNTKKQIIPNNIEEVIEYFQQNGYSLDLATRFYNYYIAADWHDKDGKKVLRWKQKAQIWFKPDEKIKPVVKSREWSN